MTSQSAIVLVDGGNPELVDPVAVADFRRRHPSAVIHCAQLEGAPPRTAVPFDRVVRLPLTVRQAATAEAIVMQLCLNEGRTVVGAVAALSKPELDRASACLEVLESGEADAVFVTGPDADRNKVFVSERASFVSSFWSALGDGLAEQRVDILSGIMKLANRKAKRLAERSGAGGSFAPMPDVDLRTFSDHALDLRQKLGISIGRLPAPKTAPVHKVAVVTPYYREPDLELLRCLDSVRGQSLQCDHFMVSDGFPNALASAPGIRHIELGLGHSDNGNTPRYVGGLVALAMGYDAIAYLDADNWFEPKHVERLVEEQRKTLATAVCSLRNIYLADGFKLTELDEEDSQRSHVDTSCYLFTRGCEYLAHLWGQMPQSWGPVCDRVVFAALAGQRVAWTKNRTINFKSNYASHYRRAQRPLPDKPHNIPRDLLQSFMAQDALFQEHSINRIGRVISIDMPRLAGRK